jgi:hypothetical protein
VEGCGYVAAMQCTFPTIHITVEKGCVHTQRGMKGWGIGGEPYHLLIDTVQTSIQRGGLSLHCMHTDGYRSTIVPNPPDEEGLIPLSPNRELKEISE